MRIYYMHVLIYYLYYIHVPETSAVKSAFGVYLYNVTRAGFPPASGLNTAIFTIIYKHRIWEYDKGMNTGIRL